MKSGGRRPRQERQEETRVNGESLASEAPGEMRRRSLSLSPTGKGGSDVWNPATLDMGF